MASPPNIVSLVDLLDSSAEKFGPRELFGTKSGPSWVYTTYAQFKKLVEDMRGGLATLGVSRGDKVGIISNNRIEWAVLAYASYGDLNGDAAALAILAAPDATYEVKVGRLLGKYGVAKEKLQVESAGSDRPLSTNGSTEGRSQNRRVDVFVLP